MVADAYPGAVPKGMVIEDIPHETQDLVVFYAGARRDGAQVRAVGGRVLGVTAYAEDADTAQRLAYSTVEAIRFDSADWRTDIGGKGRS
jgi:phosphoribosylamine--glycine ligase